MKHLNCSIRIHDGLHYLFKLKLSLNTSFGFMLFPFLPAGGKTNCWIFLHPAADLLGLEQLPVKFLLVDHLPPASQSLQFTEQSSQPAVLQLQLVDFFLLNITGMKVVHSPILFSTALFNCLHIKTFCTFNCVRVSPSSSLVQPYLFLSLMILSTPSPRALFTITLTSRSICRGYSSSLAWKPTSNKSLRNQNVRYDKITLVHAFQQ